MQPEESVWKKLEDSTEEGSFGGGGGDVMLDVSRTRIRCGEGTGGLCKAPAQFGVERVRVQNCV